MAGPQPPGTNDAASRWRRTANSANPHDFRSIATRTDAQAQAVGAPKSSITTAPSLSASAVVVAWRFAAHASRSDRQYRTRLGRIHYGGRPVITPNADEV